MTRFRVGVVTVLEVDAVDWIDAAHVAEGALKHAIEQIDNGDGKLAQVQWRHSNGHDYEAQVVLPPAELSVATYNGYVHLAVSEPTEDGCDDE